MIIPKTSVELDRMREGGAKIGVILKKLLDKAQPGVSLLAIEAYADQLIHESGGEASFRTVKGYKWSTCLCVNDVVVHGIPNEYVLQDGDVLTIDVGLLYEGLHTDTAWTKIVKSQKSKVKSERVKKKLGFAPESLALMNEKEKFLAIGEHAMWQGIAQVRAGNRVGHISQAVQKIIEGAGYGIVKTLVGHGVGRELHEEPQIPGFLKSPIETTPLLVRDMTIAVEVIYARGKGAVVYTNDDGWSIGSRDGSLTAVFEHSVVVTDGEPEVLTQPHVDTSGAGLTQAIQ
ncbi:M24 family metallopeptidase [Candidatus Gottesmanbacteria bacterium]|nr:M24 family metallopeptidase [Candidatus Gottesmanbacteria bacterium]